MHYDSVERAWSVNGGGGDHVYIYIYICTRVFLKRIDVACKAGR